MANEQNRTNVHFQLVDVDYNIPYDQQPECKRHVIGAYANLARHNMTLAVNTIMQAVGMDTYDEDSIEDAFGPGHLKKLAKLDNIQKVNLQKRLYRHFSFLKRMKLEDEQKKTVQLQTLFDVLSDFTTCMSNIRNFYTHYRPYNTPEEKIRQQELKVKMGKKLTYLFENSCQLLKSREGLKHEKNEVFYTQREEVRYSFYWFVNEKLPQNIEIEQLKKELLQSPNRKRRYGQIDYTMLDDGSISGQCRINGLKQRYTWFFKDKRSDGKSYDELLKEIRVAIKEMQKKYEEDLKRGKRVWPVSTNSVKIDNIKYRMIGEKGIIAEWTQFDRNPDYYASMSDPVKGLSDVGLIYFLCLFLDKSTAFELMEEVGFTAQCTFTKENAGESIDILQELMCLNRIRMVKSKLDSEMSEMALALDMLNELRKCPKQLYEVFTKEARDKFKDDATVNWEAVHHKEAVQTEETISEVEDDLESESSFPKQELKDTPKSTFVRWQDRFPQMALRYIDERGVFFEDIRFQLNLGKYRFAFYTHDSEHSVDGEERLRVLQKELHGFGRIQEVEMKIKELWQDLFEKKSEKSGIRQKEPDTAGQTPYITEQKPQYAIDEKSHSIGLRWEGWDNNCKDSDIKELKIHHFGNEEKEGLDKNKMFIPYIPANPVKPTDGSPQKNQAEKMLPPQALLSLYELPGLLFYQYLLEKHKKDCHIAEKLIKDYYKNMTSFLTDFANGDIKPIEGEPIKDVKKQENVWSQRKMELNNQLQKYHLKESDIPTKLRDYLCKREIDFDLKLGNSAINRLKERKNAVKKALSSFIEKRKRIGSKENKFNKMRATIKTGQLAQWLIRDITDWLPNNSISLQQLTGQKYAVLQSALTMLGQNVIVSGSSSVSVKDIEKYFREALIIEKEGEANNPKCHHPFLKEVILSCEMESSIADLYEKYLNKELEYIEKVYNIIINGDSFEDYLLIPFLHWERLHWEELNESSVQNLAIRYTKRPVQLPDGMFAKPIINLLFEKEPQLKEALQKAQEGSFDKRLDNNTAYLINMYFEKVEGDHSQPFYSTEPIEDSTSPYCHVYRIFKKLYGEKIPHTNRTTSPAYSIEELRELRKQAIGDIEAFVENEIQNWKNKQLRKFEDKQWKKLKKENDRRYKKHEKQLNIKEEVKKAVRQEIDSMRLEITSKWQRQLKKVYDNERTIRRFKTQDILLLIMARQILKAKSKDHEFESGFNLKDVMSDSLLDKPIDFDWNVNIEIKNKNDEGKTEKKIVKKTIKQEGMKMKDYGQFYKFLSDKKRLETLLSRLPHLSFLRAEIENELAHYDSNRSNVFRLVYSIEYETYKLRPYLTNDANAEPKSESNEFYYKDKKDNKLKPKRNNFYSLLEILAAGKDGILDEEEKHLLQSIRNSISHNTYEVDLSKIFEGRDSHMKIPEVADGIKYKMENETGELITRIR